MNRPETQSHRTKPSDGVVRCAFIGDEMLVVQCAVQSRSLGLDPVVLATSNPLLLDHAATESLATIDLRTDIDLAAELSARSVDVLFSIAYQRIVPADVLQQVSVAINFHDGLLPAYGGLNVTTWSLLAGEPEHGITWHLMTDLADRGGVLLEERFAVAPDDTAFALNARCYEAGLATFADVASAVGAGTVAPRPQAEGERRMYRRAERPVVAIDPARPAAELARAVRALDVGPRAWSHMGAVRWQIGEGYNDIVLVRAATAEPSASASVVGEVSLVDGALRLTTVDGDLVMSELSTPDGRTADVADVVGRHRSAPGTSTPDDMTTALVDADESLSRHEQWWGGELSRIVPDPIEPLALLSDVPRDSVDDEIRVPLAQRIEREDLLVGVAIWLDAVSNHSATAISCSDSAARDTVRSLPLCQLPIVDVRVDAHQSVDEQRTDLTTRTGDALGHGAFLADLVARTPGLRGATIEPAITVHLDAGANEELESPRLQSGLLTIVQFADGAVELRHRIADALGQRIADQLATVLAAVQAADGANIGSIPVVGSIDASLADMCNDTAVDHDRTLTIDAMFRRQADATPDAPAVSSGGTTLTYRQLATEVSHLSGSLVAAGVQPGDAVGVAVDRGIEMVTAVLAILHRGAHYLPLDPTYPLDRLAFMVDDSSTSVIVSNRSNHDVFADQHVTLIDPADRAADPTPAPGADAHGADDLAYVIYTSGSTGTPKGVQLEHRQVANFFVAMDDVIGADTPGVWLAVTSLSFDISVLELLWTITRGFHVVVKPTSGFAPAPLTDSVHDVTPARPRRPNPPSMSMFYFAADEAQAATGYRLLLESAKWADAHGFEAVWTPERHFHSFGAPYPNPSVVAAALAASTERIGIRAGSVVLPLHSPIRVAEEWAVVDNLSGGRVGISFAAGWQPNDFVLNPGAYADARNSLPGLIDTVQRLWRGETVSLPGHDGAPVSVQTLPRPVQPELPVWLTSAGSPASFERAGHLGLNILTHLIGQTNDQLADNIARYRAAWVAAGHEGQGAITLMLHTYLHEDGDLARETARLPLKGYLGTAVGLLKDLASAFPTFGKSGADADEAFRSLTDDEISQLLDHAADRYLTTAGLFGTVDDAVTMMETVSAAGVDEIACLIDFGIDDDLVLENLELIGTARERILAEWASNDDAVAAPSGSQVEVAVDDTVAALFEHHGVTHFQCTPSLASMLVANPTDREALRSVRHMMVGGEALPVGLASELRTLLPDRLTNMYGPTETTIWSLVHEITEVGGNTVPIGRPIANTTMHVLDDFGRALPIGALGELHLGGEGVARGYHGRPELTSERFVDRGSAGRVYATGDVVRIRPDGVVEFGGRSDNQVKIRGHRIELPEIESVIDRHPAVVQSVVVARGDGEPQLVAFVVTRAGEQITAQAIRAHVGASLPDAMVPSKVGVLDALPLTPNGKVDRKRLPDDVQHDHGATGDPSTNGADDAQRSDSQSMVLAVWRAELGDHVGVDDNFFDVGGHSLLAVKVFREISGTTDGVLALTDVFRYPTVRAFADHLDALASVGAVEPSTASVSAGSDRGAKRRRARSRRPGGATQ